MTEILTITDSDGDTVAIHEATAVADGAYVLSGGTSPATVTKDEAPAFALALLEATGWTADHNGGTMAHALTNLAKHVKQKAEEEARKAAEAEDAAKLEAEALTLLNAYRLSNGREARTSLDEINNETSREGWRTIARKARELHAQPEPEAAPEPPSRFSIVQSEKRPGMWLILDAEKPGKGAAFGGKYNAENGLAAMEAGVKFFFEPLFNHFN
ncbi:hypothetical protein AB4Y81_03015 [Paenarthrobacter sp. TAF1]|uniref:hypothetical protein n=1 Tax=Paenarthrobacter sp. TAF1 TaxID=3233067 RepID=UPI003F982D0A